MSINRVRLDELALGAFQLWLADLTDGEVADMLCGNSSAYRGMPNLSPWVEQQEINEVWEYHEAQR